jgi:hypothetical protein
MIKALVTRLRLGNAQLRGSASNRYWREAEPSELAFPGRAWERETDMLTLIGPRSSTEPSPCHSRPVQGSLAFLRAVASLFPGDSPNQQQLPAPVARRFGDGHVSRTHLPREQRGRSVGGSPDREPISPIVRMNRETIHPLPARQAFLALTVPVRRVKYWRMVKTFRSGRDGSGRALRRSCQPI